MSRSRRRRHQTIRALWFVNYEWWWAKCPAREEDKHLSRIWFCRAKVTACEYFSWDRIGRQDDLQWRRGGTSERDLLVGDKYSAVGPKTVENGRVLWRRQKCHLIWSFVFFSQDIKILRVTVLFFLFFLSQRGWMEFWVMKWFDLMRG